MFSIRLPLCVNKFYYCDQKKVQTSFCAPFLSSHTTSSATCSRTAQRRTVSVLVGCSRRWFTSHFRTQKLPPVSPMRESWFESWFSCRHFLSGRTDRYHFRWAKHTTPLSRNGKTIPWIFFLPSSSPPVMYCVLHNFERSASLVSLGPWSMVLLIQRTVPAHSTQGLHTYAIEQASTDAHRFGLLI